MKKINKLQLALWAIRHDLRHALPKVLVFYLENKRYMKIKLHEIITLAAVSKHIPLHDAARHSSSSPKNSLLHLWQ